MILRSKFTKCGDIYIDNPVRYGHFFAESCYFAIYEDIKWGRSALGGFAARACKEGDAGGSAAESSPAREGTEPPLAGAVGDGMGLGAKV